MDKRKWILIAVAAAALVVGCLVGFLLSRDSGSEPWQEDYDMGMYYWQEGRYEEAVVRFDTVLGMDPDNDMARFFLADCLLKLAQDTQDPDLMENYLDQAERTIKDIRPDANMAVELETLLAQAGSLRQSILAPEPATEETVDLGEPEITEATQPATEATEAAEAPVYTPQTGTTSHNPQVTPDTGSGTAPEATQPNNPGHNDQVIPDDDDQVDLGSPDTGSDIPEIDLGEPEIVPVPGGSGDDQVDLGSPDTGGSAGDNSGHSDQVLPDTGGDDMVDLGSPTD